MDKIRKKRARSVILASLSSAVLVAAAYTAFADQPARWGPIECWFCKMQMPYPDAADERLLRNFVKDPYPNQISIFAKKPEIGDVITICNQKICVDYQLNQSRNFEGIRSRPIHIPGGGGGGTGGSGGGTGTFTPPSTGGGGTVTVGPALPPCRPKGIGPEQPEGTCMHF